MDHDLRETIDSWTPSPGITPGDEDWFPPVFEQAPFGIAAIDMTGHFVRVNPACAALHGRSREELVGEYALAPDADPAARVDYEATFELGREGDLPRYQAEHRIVRPDGTEVWALVAATMVRDDADQPVYALVEYHDTTPIHEMAEEARLSNEAFQLTFENAPIAIYSVDTAGRVIDWNPTAERLFGWPAEEVIGQPIPIVPRDGMDAAIEGLERLLRGETIPAEEATVVHRDGTPIQVVTSATMTVTPDGAPDRIVAFALDVTQQRRAEADLSERDRWMRTIFSKISETVTVVGPDGRVRFSTGQYSDVLGYPNEFWDELDMLSLVHPDDREAAAKRFEELLDAPGVELTDVFRMADNDQQWIPVEVVGVNLLADPDVGGVVLTTRNLTEFRKAKLLLEDEARILELIATGAPLSDALASIVRMVERNSRGGTSAIILFEPDRRMRIVEGPNLPERLRAEIDGRRPFGLFARAVEEHGPVAVENVDRDETDPELVAASKSLGVISGWVDPILATGTHEILGLVATYFSVPDPDMADGLAVSELASQLAAIALDRSRSHDALHHQAHHDALTGLPNRAMIVKRLEELLSGGDATVGGAAVMFLDLDRFKVVNDSLGHRAGDALLGMFADRIRGLARPGDLVGRFSADEFVILVASSGIDDLETLVHTTANRVEVALSEPFALDEGDIYLSVSTGVAFAGAEESTAHQLLEHASAAMVEAKKRGRERMEVFDQAMREQAHQRLQRERDLRMALEHNEFVLHYQPKIELATGRIIGVEALVRWEHPTLGLVMPDDFIPVAEETGMIVRIGRWVLEEAVRQAREWCDRYPGLDHFVMAVNFSPRQMTAPDLVTNLARVLLKYDWPPERLSVEVTESILIDDADGSLDTLEQLVALGVKLTIDDFGTGYSSLSYLHRFPVDIVKIDRAFVTDLRADGTGSMVAAAIMQMADALDVITAAEGVETDEQLQGLRALGCNWAQGFLFSTPIPADDLGEMLADGA